MKKARCSFCGNEMDCSKNMLDAKGHICADCFDRMGEEGIAIFPNLKNN